MNDHLDPIFRDVLNSFAALSIRPTASVKPLPRRPRYIDTFDARVAGIPCQIGVIEFDRVAGSFNANAPSDLDYHGYTECEFDVLDRNGRPALWLERKLTDDDRFAIEDKIADRFAD